MIKSIFKRIHNPVSWYWRRDWQRKDAVAQMNLMTQYAQMYAAGLPPLVVKNTGFRVHSQHEEDGILLFIFALIGMRSKKVIEICCGDGIECNAANFLRVHGWTGLLFEGNEKLARKARRFYKRCPDTRFWPPQVICDWISAENINKHIKENGFAGEIDLLSTDIDGIDYWLWKAIDSARPRVVVAEVNHLLGPDRSMTVPYDPKFRAGFTRYGSDYAGASLPAFVKLAKEKGYRLIGTNRFVTNAFFVSNEDQHPWLPEVSAESCFGHPRATFGMQDRFPLIELKPWQEV
jgi:hypothetical protein